MYAIRKPRRNVTLGVRIYPQTPREKIVRKLETAFRPFPLPFMASSHSGGFETARKNASKLRSYFGVIEPLEVWLLVNLQHLFKRQTSSDRGPNREYSFSLAPPHFYLFATRAINVDLSYWE